MGTAESGTRYVARALGAACVGTPTAQVRDLIDASTPVSVLDADTLAVADVHALSVQLHAEQSLLVVELCCFAACRACELGADIVILSDLGLVALSRRATQCDLAVGECDLPLVAVEDRERAWRSGCDVAQVVASYLRAHPAVSSVCYPGLPDDASHEVATRTLHRGFGPALTYRSPTGERYVLNYLGAERASDEVNSLERTIVSSPRS